MSFSSPRATVERRDGHLDVHGYQVIAPQKEELLSIHVPSPREGGRWRLRSAGRGACASYFARGIPAGGFESYHTDENHDGTVVITHFDTTRHIVEGTFEFDGILGRRDGPRQRLDTLHMRNGVFRVRYQVVSADAYQDDPNPPTD